MTNTFWYFKKPYREIAKLISEFAKYNSVDPIELHKVWKATGTNGNRKKIFTYEGSTWERVAYKTKSRSRKSEDWTVYFSCLETGERIDQKISPYDRGYKID